MFDLERIARITGGEFSGRKVNCQLSEISTDSRNLNPGSLFVPLRGERFDGHDYLSQAVKNGAAACLSEEVIAGLSVPVIRVADTLQALGDIAAVYRLQLNGPLVAITGSAGKTTTKEMLATILEQVAPGLKTAGNFNNLIEIISKKWFSSCYIYKLETTRDLIDQIRGKFIALLARMLPCVAHIAFGITTVSYYQTSFHNLLST